LWEGTTYHDAPLKPLKADMDAYVWHYIRRQVAQAQECLFPPHDLAPPEEVLVGADRLDFFGATPAELPPNARFSMVAEPEPQRVVQVERRPAEGEVGVAEEERLPEQPAKKRSRRSRRRKRGATAAANQRAPSAEQERDAAASRRRRRRRSRRKRKRRK